MTYDPGCTGCPRCDPEIRAAMSAFSAGDYETYCQWLTRQDENRMRAAGAHGGLRASLHLREDHMTDHYAPPDPYENDLKKLRAAATTPLSTFEERYKAERLRELEAEYAERDALRPAQRPEPRVTDLSAFVPPDPYRAALDKMKEDR